MAQGRMQPGGWRNPHSIQTDMICDKTRIGKDPLATALHFGLCLSTGEHKDRQASKLWHPSANHADFRRGGARLSSKLNCGRTGTVANRAHRAKLLDGPRWKERTAVTNIRQVKGTLDRTREVGLSIWDRLTIEEF